MIKRIGEHQRACRAVQYGDFFESGGIVAEDAPKDIVVQTKMVLAELEEILALANLEKNNLTRIQIWLSDINDFEGMNSVYDAWVKDFDKPARATVESKLAGDQYLIEIQAFAYSG